MYADLIATIQMILAMQPVIVMTGFVLLAIYFAASAR